MNITIYDNSGETFDRYTVIIDNDVFRMSSDPLSPQGFHQYCMDVSEFKPSEKNKLLLIEQVPPNILIAITKRLTTN